MAFSDLEFPDCACAFVDNLGPFKQTFTSLLDSIIAIMTAIKATIALWPADLGDQLKKIALEANLVVIEAAVSNVEAPFKSVNMLMSPYADCPPVATAARTITDVRNLILGPLDEAKEEVQLLIDALNLDQAKLERLDMLINQLNDLKDAIEFCGAA
jgi:hypothetical protein